MFKGKYHLLHQTWQAPVTLMRETFRLFYPRVCRGCDGAQLDAEDWICLACIMHLPRTGFGVRREQAAYRTFEGRISLLQAGSYLYFREGGITRQILHAIKYRNQSQLAVKLGYFYAGDLADAVQVPDVLIPVPMHPHKQRIRGYNQAERIAMGMSQAWRTRLETGWLHKTRSTASQTRASRANRWLNTGDRFVANLPTGAAELHIAVVDDVLTTGATLEACLQTLAKSGCKTLSIFTLAITETGK